MIITVIRKILVESVLRMLPGGRIARHVALMRKRLVWPTTGQQTKKCLYALRIFALIGLSFPSASWGVTKEELEALKAENRPAEAQDLAIQLIEKEETSDGCKEIRNCMYTWLGEFFWQNVNDAQICIKDSENLQKTELNDYARDIKWILESYLTIKAIAEENLKELNKSQQIPDLSTPDPSFNPEIVAFFRNVKGDLKGFQNLMSQSPTKSDEKEKEKKNENMIENKIEKEDFNPGERIKEAQLLKRKQLRPAYKKEILKQYDIQQKFFGPVRLEGEEDRKKMLEIAKQLVMRRVISGYVVWKTHFPVIVTGIRPKIVICAERLVIEFSKDIVGKTKDNNEGFRNDLGWVWVKYATGKDGKNGGYKNISEISPSETVKLGNTTITYAQHFLLSSSEKHFGNYVMDDIGRYPSINNLLKSAINFGGEPIPQQEKEKREKALGKLMLRYMQTGEPVKVEDLINICGPWWKCLANVGGNEESQKKVDESISAAIKKGPLTGAALQEIMTDNKVDKEVELENFKRFLRVLFPSLQGTKDGYDFLKFVKDIFANPRDFQNTSIACGELWMKTPEEWKELDDKALMRIVRRQPKLEVKPLTTQDRKERYDEFYGEYTTNKNAFYGKAAEDLYLKRQVDSLDSLNRIFYHVCVKEIARYMCADGKKYNVTGAFAQERSIQLLAEGKLTIDNVFNTDATYGPLTIGGWSRGHIDRQYAVNRKYDKHLLKSDKNKRHNPEQDNDIITSYAKLTKELKDAFDGDKSQLKRKRSKKDSNDPEKIIKKVELEKNAETPKNEEEDASWKTSSSAASNNSNNKIESENETKIENEKEKESNLSDDIEPTTPKTPDGLENMFENVFNGGQNEPDFELDELKTAPKTTI